MNTLRTGYARVNIDPQEGVAISGYYIPRFVKGYLDEVEASCLALTAGETPVLVFSVDTCLIRSAMARRFNETIAAAAGVPAENIFLSCTHSHTTAMLEPSGFFEADEAEMDRYAAFLLEKLCQVAVEALQDLRPTCVGFGTVTAPDRIAYIRRYRMKDGSTMTCPPVDDPNIDHPLGELDQRVNVLRFDREGAESVVILNYGLHADTINGELSSADWPGWVRKTLDVALDGAKCMCIMGAQGDVGSTNVHPIPGDMNDTEISFDNEMKSPGMARFVGRALAGAVLQIFDKVEYVDVDTVSAFPRVISVAANVPDPADLPRAYEYKALHDAGRDHELPYTGMQLTTAVAEAMRMVRLEHGPETFDLRLTGLRLGEIALVGISGEPFTEVGVRIKENAGWKLVMPCALVNGYDGYFPTTSAYDEGGYEAAASNYRRGVADTIVDNAARLLKTMEGDASA